MYGSTQQTQAIVAAMARDVAVAISIRSVREHCSPNSDEKCIERATKCSACSPEQPNKAGPFTVQPNIRKNIEWGRPVPKAPEQP